MYKLKVVRAHTWWSRERKICTLLLLSVAICICKKKSIEIVNMSVYIFFLLKKRNHDPQIILDFLKKGKKKPDYRLSNDEKIKISN